MDNDLIRDVYKQLGELTAKVDDIRSIRDTAVSAQSTANKALQIAEQNSDAQATADRAEQMAKRNEDELKGIRAEQSNNRRWLLTTIITAVFNVIGIIITLVTLIL